MHNECNKSQAKKVNPEQIESDNDLEPGTFHRNIKKDILNDVPPNYTVGKNPDIMIDRKGFIAYQGTKGRGFQDTGLNIAKYIGRHKKW